MSIEAGYAGQICAVLNAVTISSASNRASRVINSCGRVTMEMLATGVASAICSGTSTCATIGNCSMRCDQKLTASVLAASSR